MAGNKDIFARNLIHYMEKKGVDRNQLCSDLDLKYSTVRDWIKGITYPRIGKIELLANYFGVQKSDLIEDKKTPIDNHQGVETSSTLQQITDTSSQLEHERQLIVLDTAKQQLDEQNTIQEEPADYNSEKIVKLYNSNEEYESLIVHGLESAGEGIWQEGDTDIEVRVPTSEIPDEFDDLAMVIGDSMRPRLHNGDILFITFTKQIEVGEIGVFRTSKGNFVKRLQIDRLESLNPDYDDIYFTEDEFAEAVGVVVDVYRK